MRFDFKLIEQSKAFEQEEQKLDDAIDDKELDEIDKHITEYGGDRKASMSKQPEHADMTGASKADNDFMEKFKKEKEIEKQLREKVSRLWASNS